MNSGDLFGVLWVLFEMDFSRLFTAKIWIDAATQSFLQFSCGYAFWLCLATHNKVDTKLYSFLMKLTWFSIGASFLSCFVIFGYLNHYFKEIMGEPIHLWEEHSLHGPGLMFIVYTAIFTQMP